MSENLSSGLFIGAQLTFPDKCIYFFLFFLFFPPFFLSLFYCFRVCFYLFVFSFPVVSPFVIVIQE